MARIVTETLGRQVIVAGGGFLAGIGLRRGEATGALVTIAGLGLVLSGLRLEEEALRRPGRLAVNDGPKWPVELRQSVTIDKPRFEVFAFFRDHCALTDIAPHIERVQLAPDTNFGRWVLDTPSGPLHFEAELTDYRAPERVAWRAVKGTDVQGEGWVEFRDAGGGRATAVHIYMRWSQPVGRFSRLAAWLASHEPANQVGVTLERAKQQIESGWQSSLQPRHAEAEMPEIAGRRPAMG